MNDLLAQLGTRVPARYVPFAAGRYEVKAGLHRFGTDFGNGARDGQVFQLDREFTRYRAAKMAACSEGRDRHVLTDTLAPAVAEAVVCFMVERLVAEHPRCFRAGRDLGRPCLECGLVDERLVFDDRWRLVPGKPGGVRRTSRELMPSYASAFDALASVIQEDLAVTSVDRDRHWLSALHVCLPSHWSPRDKIGRTFAEVHEPVAGMEAMNRRAGQYVEQMIGAEEGLVRFVWGLQADDRLNRHPDGSRMSPAFDPEEPRAFVRVERQTIWGFPAAGASLFTIRPYLMDVKEIAARPDECRALIAALRSMPADSAVYKGLASWRDDLVAWLEGRAENPQ